MYAVKNLPCCLSLGYSFYSFHLHFQTVGRYRISHKCPNPSLCQSRPQKQRSHRTTSPLSTALVLLVAEVHWASLELSEIQPQHSCQVVLLSAHVLSSSRGCQETPEVCYWRWTRLYVVQSIIATTNIVNAMGNIWCTVTFFCVVLG